MKTCNEEIKHFHPTRDSSDQQKVKYLLCLSFRSTTVGSFRKRCEDYVMRRFLNLGWRRVEHFELKYQ